MPSVAAARIQMSAKDMIECIPRCDEDVVFMIRSMWYIQSPQPALTIQWSCKHAFGKGCPKFVYCVDLYGDLTQARLGSYYQTAVTLQVTRRECKCTFS